MGEFPSKAPVQDAEPQLDTETVRSRTKETEERGRKAVDIARLAEGGEEIGGQRFTPELIAKKTKGFEPSNNEKKFEELKKTIDDYKRQKPDSDLETYVMEDEITVENAKSYTKTTYGYKMLYVNGKYLLYRMYMDEKEIPKTQEELESQKSLDIADAMAWAEATAEEFLVDYERADVSEVPKVVGLPKAGQSRVGHHEPQGGEITYYVVCQGRHKDYYAYKSNTKKKGARI